MSITVRISLTFLLAFWLLGVFAEWLLPVIPQVSLLIPFLEKSYSLVCHQQPSKLLGESVYHSLVCSRCAGIYVGFFAASLISILITFKSDPPLKFILILSLPMLVDVLFYSIGIYAYSKSLAFITGFLLGSVGFLYFYSALKKLIQEIKSKSN